MIIKIKIFFRYSNNNSIKLYRLLGIVEEAANIGTMNTVRPASAMDYFKTTPNNGDSFGITNNNNSLTNNNNTNIKDERLSPPQQQQPQDMTQTSSGISGSHVSHSRYVFA